MPNKSLQIRIQLAKKALKLEDYQYRALLSGFGVESSKDLTDGQAMALLATFNKMGYEPGAKYNKLVARGADAATPRQLRYIEGLWEKTARDPSKNALRAFIKRLTQVDSIEWISRQQAHIVISALQKMEGDRAEMAVELAQHMLKKPAPEYASGVDSGVDTSANDLPKNAD
jgi:hypothetical protein